MLAYGTGSSLKSLMDGKVTGAFHDDWLVGWMTGYLHRLFAGRWPVRILDIEIGKGERPYRDVARAEGATVSCAEENALVPSSGDFGLILALSFHREACLAPVDAERPYALAKTLADAAILLAPGGALVWSYLYAFPDDGVVHDLLEPGAIYRSMILRGLLPMGDDRGAYHRVHIYHDPDTLFVRQRAVLAHSDRQRRIIRVLCAATRPPARKPGRGGSAMGGRITPRRWFWPVGR